MDKNKSRTDMLAAGRKKLQQFRQKKDKGSGSHGKSTKKSGKSEQHEADADADAVSTATKPTAWSQVREGETESPEGSNSEIVNTSVSNSAESDTSVAVVGPSVPITHEKNVVEIELEKKLNHHQRNWGSVSLKLTLLSRMKRFREGKRESLPSRENIDISLMQEREDQVTDVGAMQEADGLDARQSNPSREAEVELEGDIRPSVSELERSVEPFSGPASYVDEQTDVVDEASAREVEVVLKGDNNLLLAELDTRAELDSRKIDEASVPDGAPMFDGHSASSLALSEADGSSVGSAAVPGSFNEEKLELQFGSGFGQDREERVLVDSEHQEVAEHCHQEHVLDGWERPLETNVMSSDRGSASPVADLSSVSVSQLTEVIKRLNEEEFRLLLKSVESVSSTMLGTTVELLDETSLLRASLIEVREKSQCLAEELAQCRRELQAVACGKEELQNQLHTAKVEVEEVSSRAIELHNNLERAQQDVFRLSTELADCKGLVQTLQVENENLNGTIASVDEDRRSNIKLKWEFGFRKQRIERGLRRRGEHLSCENEKLAIELADSKNSVSALQVENASLNGNLALVTEEKKKLEEEKEYSAYENERLSAELVVLQERLSAEREEQVRYQNYSSLRVEGSCDEHVEERALTDNQSPEDSVVSVREQIGNLRALFKQLLLDATNASLLLKEEQDGRKNAEATFGELKDQNEALEEYSKKLEATNIELGVLYEALEQHRGSIESRNCELLILCESFQLEVTNMKAEHVEVDRKLHVYESRTCQLQSRLHDLHLSSNDMVSQISEQLGNFHKEAAEKVLTLEQYWNSTIDPVLEAIGKLDESLGSVITTTSVSHDYLGRISHFVASVYDAISFIQDLKDKLESSQTEHEAVSILYKEVNKKCDDLHGKNEMVSDLLRKLYGNLTKLLTVLHGSTDESEMYLETEKLPDPLDYKLTARGEEFEELKQRCLDSTTLQKLIEDVKGVLKVEHAEFQVGKTPASHLKSLVSCLVQKCEEADVQVGLSKEDYGSKVVELNLMLEEVQQLNALCLQHESKLIVLRESLHQAEESLLVARSELQGKVNELEQSEQRVSSLREKLTIAVTKGKGLIVQRDGLKHSLTEKSIELERFSQELQLKDARLLEIETKLKAYSESGERVEALESELSYIRNSATALRESFLLKDSALQRIEEILEDLDLPEDFHSRDIIEKIDWLARKAISYTYPATDSDQKTSAGGGAYSDAGFVVMDSWKDDVQPSSDLSEDFKRKYEELQSKFYGVAEQNEMLEQSLMERNNIVQRWEELLDRIEMPSHLRSVEPEDRIEWLKKTLSEVQEDNMSLQQKVVNLENHCVSLTADSENSQRRVSDLEADLRTFIHERDHLSERLGILVNDHEKISAKAAEFEHENEKLQKEVTDMQENVAKMHGNENKLFSIEADLRRLQSLVTDALEDSVSKYEYSGGSSIERLEGLLNKLLESYATLSLENLGHGGAAEGLHTENADATAVGSRSLNTQDPEESDIAALKKELEEVQCELLDVKEERDGYLEKQQSLASELEALNKKVNELQGLLNQEEQKSASVREKLNVAVRKGKSLVQQRDSLKQNIDEINSEVERLRSEIKVGEVKIAQYEQKFRDLSTYPGRVEALESETLFLRNCLNETEQNLQHKANTLSMILNILDKIDVGGDFNYGDPVVKLEQIGKMCLALHADVASSEQEARKSKRAAELLLAELNEVQERNDGLQEELAKSAGELAILSKERDLAEAGKLEAVLSLEKLSTAHSEERKNQFSEFAGLKSGVDQLRKGFHDISSSLAGLFYKELEFLNNMESGIDSCLKSNSADVVDVHPFTATGGFVTSKSDQENFISMNSLSDPNAHGHFDDNFVIEIFTYVSNYVQELLMEIGVLKEKLGEHSMSLHEKTSSVSRLMAIVRGEITCKNESFEALKRDFLQMEMVKKEKDKELFVLHRNAALLFEACTSSVVEIDKRKAELVGNSWAVADLGMTLKSAELPAGGLSFSGEGQLYSEESVRSVADRLLSAASDFATLTGDIVEGSQKEMKLTISNLQKELQEKDVQKERIFMELVSQIKEAEATASSYSMDLESSKTLVHDLEKQLEVMKGERNLFEQRVKELEDGRATSAELQERVRSLTDVIAAKDHEIEELMQALDEEEVQMQGITYKIKELEKIVEQKNLEIENLEASRGKVMKKLSITVNKFDELHHLSASLLAEVEKLQSQLQDRDAEISFLRQEVTRCTNDVLVASQVSNKGSSDEINELLAWFDMNIARVGVHNEYLEDLNNGHVPEQKEVLKKTVDSILSELGDLRAAAQRKDMLLQEERTKVEELIRKGENLEKSLREKESRLNLLEGVEDSGQATITTSEIHEVEPVINKWAASGSSIASQVRSLRKANSEQVAIAIDMDPGSTSRLEDEDDEKVHGFKSLTTSRMVPRFTRPVTDMVDGLWVSCDRTLMRKPILRLGIIFYWAFLHALLATLAIEKPNGLTFGFRGEMELVSRLWLC
ncbi:hypothetical protein M0R45_012201 [Rubus argutus]|uniref:Uncharacterized protein n=1 Tax=Rubus argutus TaxID=59490 RepID=A0AAW1YEY8_RUBAR